MAIMRNLLSTHAMLVLFVATVVFIVFNNPIDILHQLKSENNEPTDLNVDARQQSAGSNKSYINERNKVMHAENLKRIGGRVEFDECEKKIDENLLQLKRDELNPARNGRSVLGPQINFLKSRRLYEASEVFKFIQRMPKGGALHLHDGLVVDLKKVISVFTYRQHCYMCFGKDGNINFKFYQNPPVNPDCPWRQVHDVRAEAKNVIKFDELLRRSLSFTPEDTEHSMHGIWQRFTEIIMRARGLLTYAPVLRDYFYMILEEFFEDNVQYLEVRSCFTNVYRLNGTKLEAHDVMALYIEAIELFKETHPEFIGAKLIYSGIRFGTQADVLKGIQTSIALLKKYPEYFAGYDLVMNEDQGVPLIDNLDALLWPGQQNPPIHLPYFFHAGETSWQGARADLNLVDAVLLNTTRIGHGFALTKHPKILQIVKDVGICVEINPISNQVLKLVNNLQNHPAASYMSDTVPVVISSDDNSVWGAIGLSYDFYAAFMVMTGEDDGLQVLKQLSMNSLIYSSLDNGSKTAAVEKWEHKWNAFIKHEKHTLD